MRTRITVLLICRYANEDQARQHKIEEDITFIRTKFSQAVNLGGTAPLLSIYKWQGLRDYYGDPDLKLPIAERTTLEFERRQSMFEITNFLFGVHAGQTNGEKFETTGDVLLRKQALFREWRGGNPGPILAAPAAAVRTSTTASISAPAPAPGDQQQ